MITIHLVEPGADGPGRVHDVLAKPGQSLMQAAVAAGIAGIAADCGGMLTCATCHVYLREPWASRVAAPVEDERSMLEFAAAARKEGSRLSCQVMLTSEHDGLTADLPTTQY